MPIFALSKLKNNPIVQKDNGIKYMKLYYLIILCSLAQHGLDSFCT